MTVTPGLVAALGEQQAAWRARPLVRSLYHEWYAAMARELSPVDGPTLELGCGFGSFKEFRPETVATDVEPTPWTEEVIDACRIDRPDGSVANLVMTDVLHHLPHPGRFFTDATRVLRPGGRVVMVEPYCSPLSGPVYRFLHFEGADLRADPFSASAQSGDHPLEANNALASLLFWRHVDRYQALHPTLAVARRVRFAPLVYPLSGGFSGRQLVPAAAVAPLRALERRLAPLMPWAAFRCLVVLEKRA